MKLSSTTSDAVDVNPGAGSRLWSCQYAELRMFVAEGGKRDRWHVDRGMPLSAALSKPSTSGWISRVVDIVVKQLEKRRWKLGSWRLTTELSIPWSGRS